MIQEFDLSILNFSSPQFAKEALIYKPIYSFKLCVSRRYRSDPQQRTDLGFGGVGTGYAATRAVWGLNGNPICDVGQNADLHVVRVRLKSLIRGAIPRDWVLGKMNRGLKKELRFDLGSGDSEAFFVGNSRGGCLLEAPTSFR